MAPLTVFACEMMSFGPSCMFCTYQTQMGLFDAVVPVCNYFFVNIFLSWFEDSWNRTFFNSGNSKYVQDIFLEAGSNENWSGPFGAAAQPTTLVHGPWLIR